MNAQNPRVVVLSAWLIVALAASAAAQLPQTGTIVGRVMDGNGGAIPGVTVEATSPSLIRPGVTTTDARGAYRLTLLPIGDYRVACSLPGFSNTVREGIPVSADQALTIDITLGVAAVSESKVVNNREDVGASESGLQATFSARGSSLLGRDLAVHAQPKCAARHARGARRQRVPASSPTGRDPRRVVSELRERPF